MSKKREIPKRLEVATWYLINVWPYVSGKEDEIEWLVTHLQEPAFKAIEGMYDEQMNKLEADGFFK